MNREPQRKRKRARSPDATERELEQFIFGFAPDTEPEPEPVVPIQGATFNFIDTSSSEDEEQQVAVKKRRTEEPVAAWHDEDDEELVVDLTTRKRWRDEVEETEKEAGDFQAKLREHHSHLNTNVAWAQLDEPEGNQYSSFHSDLQDPFLSSANNLLRHSFTKLPEDNISVTKVADANMEDPAKVTTVRFYFLTFRLSYSP
jgi:hypothetical protein